MSTQTLNIEEIQGKLYEKLKASGWGEPLRMFIMSGDFKNILNTLYNEASVGKRFTPVLKQLFTAFEECPYDKVKVVIIGEDPHPHINAADGIGLSCSNLNKVEPVLQAFQKQIQETVYNNPEHEMNSDLRYLSNQGVLLLNSALTTTIDKLGTHTELWRPFMNYLLDTLVHQKKNLLYVFMGTKTQEWNRLISQDNFKFFTTHPYTAPRNNDGKWNTGNLFNNINTVLIKNNQTKIQW